MITRAALLTAVAALAASPALPQANPRGEAKATLAGKTVAVEYGRPSLKGRDMLGQAQVGQTWRLGADSATTLKTEADLAFGSATVPMGEYILTATKVAADEWQLNVAARDRTKVAAIPLTMGKVGQTVETFTIEITGERDKGEFSMMWGDTALKASFTAN